MTQELPYFYETQMEWVAGKKITVRAPDLPEFVVAPPVEFGGEGGLWTPEHLFVTSANSCFGVTFLAMAQASKLDFVSFDCTAKGKLEKVEGSGLQITEMVLKPSLVIRRDADLERALRLLEKAEKACLISKSMKTVVRLEPQVDVLMPETMVA